MCGTGLRKESNVVTLVYYRPFFLFLIYFKAQFPCAFEKKKACNGQQLRRTDVFFLLIIILQSGDKQTQGQLY
jgi:hypothetical protein